MSALAEKLPSKIVQYDSDKDVALCEDGSVWYYEHQEKIWLQMHPPHEPSTKAADFAEALTVLSNLLSCAEPNSKTGWEYYKDAEKFLDKHGA